MSMWFSNLHSSQPSLKLTAISEPLKTNAWKTKFPFWDGKYSAERTVKLLPLDPKTIKNEGFEPPIYGL